MWTGQADTYEPAVDGAQVTYERIARRLFQADGGVARVLKSSVTSIISTLGRRPIGDARPCSTNAVHDDLVRSAMIRLSCDGSSSSPLNSKSTGRDRAT